MGPKKEVKNAIQQPPKQVQPEPLPYQITGYGRFEYLSGVIYEGNWIIIKGTKVKSGYGRLLLPQGLVNGKEQQYYEGNWQNDKMQGFGIYHYAEGSIYSGEWKNNKHHGKGRLELANGTYYEGTWRDHLMHGFGFYVDHLNRKWQGQFRDGVFESRKQKQLSKQKFLDQNRNKAKLQIKQTITNCIKNLNDNTAPDSKVVIFFGTPEQTKQFIKGQIVNLETKGRQGWLSILKQANDGQIKILTRRSDCKTINGERLLVRQQQGQGQVAQILFKIDGKNKSILLLQFQKRRWIIVAIKEQQN